jgi:predicted DNA binding CopG/RHH family protein
MAEAMSKMYREDPYDAMSEEEFEGEILAMLERTKTRAVSLRLPLDLIERTKAVAADQQVPYQTLMKAFIDGGVRKLEQSHRGRTGTQRRPKTPARLSRAGKRDAPPRRSN